MSHNIIKPILKSRVITTLAVVALLLGISSTLSVSTPTAHAAGSKICLYYNDNYCLTGNGLYNPVTTVTSGGNSWTTLSGGGNTLMFQNGSGNCLRTEDNQDVVEVGGACSSSNNNDRWVNGGSNGRLTFQSVAWSPFYLGTFGVANGNDVITANPQNNFFSGWTLE